MKEEVNPEDVSLMGIWAWWWIRSRKPGTRIEIPPMPPLEEWPKEILETLKRISGKTIVKK
ncbi:hypothetical protein [Hyalangium rubrum]|uniref:Uncharacterized protein n=1 Tax=Hyalangium rubrum TaxID=3103134 RepID=A0ABU5GXW3_9BACT|nr:hypothetical protein [Hyalangium sp. s54d21]MDY7225712.1 hypothetical protein [Hyalangium sp. s54d21]